MTRSMVVLGFDGTPYTFMEKYSDKGAFPNFMRLRESGGFSPLRSVYPTVSSVAWSNFMTGTNPGKHGIFGFVDRRPGTLKLYIPNSSNQRGQTLWELLSGRGRRTFVMNVPVTFPPRKVNGTLISGFLAPDVDKATYPPSIAEALKRNGYRIDIDPWKARESLDFLLSDLDEVTDRRRRAMLHYFDKGGWDYFHVHFMGTDRINHFMWELMEKRDERYYKPFIRYYRKLDSILGEMLDRLERKGDQELMVLSDHGFCSVKKEVFVNRLLEEQGYLSYRKDPPESHEDITGGSRAYSFDPGRIYVNLKGREPEGSVKPGEDFESLLDELTSLLMGLRDPDDGSPIVRKVMRREELFNGPLAERGPDLVAVPFDGYDLKGPLNKRRLYQKDKLLGMHTYENAFVAIGGHKIRAEDPEVMDAFPTILELMGEKVPDGLDGRSML
jgi:predicted AlkP superfamily phosphohydrolase/phosphomutase